MINLLLEKIKELEERLENYSKNINKSKEEIVKLFKECKINKDKKKEFKERFKNAIEKLNIENKDRFFEKNFLKYPAFVKIIENLESGYLVLVDGNYENDIKNFILGFLSKKISPFFTIDKDIIIGIVEESQYKELKNLKTIPYYNPITLEFSDIPLYKMFFLSENYNLHKLEKAKQIFKEFRLRPAYKNKHFIEYSLDLNKIVDFEREKLNKEKEKYSSIFEEPYANLENRIKREKEIPLILAVLERIDNEIGKIKNSKGITNIVVRILNFIEFNFPEFSEEVKYLRNKIKE